MRLSMSQLTTRYSQHREAILAYEREFVTCECGHSVKRQGLSSHKTHSPRHRVWKQMVASQEAKKEEPFEMTFA